MRAIFCSQLSFGEIAKNVNSEGRGKKGPGQKGVEKYLSRNAIQCIQNDRRPCDLNSESLLMVYYDANKE